MKTEKPYILADRMKLLLSTAKFADAHFLVGQNDKKEHVLAHRAILSASSDVFESMFQKEATENANGKIGGKTSAERMALCSSLTSMLKPSNEVHAGKYIKSADVFSLGYIFFLLLTRKYLPGANQMAMSSQAVEQQQQKRMEPQQESNMSFSPNSTIAEFTADQAPYQNESLTPTEELQQMRITEMERMQKMSLHGRYDNGHKMGMAEPDTLADRMKLLLSTAKGADAHFLVGQSDKKELVHAHKAILIASSNVFEAMFQTDKENSNGTNAANISASCPVVEVPDVEPAAFKIMLSFIYTDDLSELNGDNAMDVLHAAKKYNIPRLVDASLLPIRFCIFMEFPGFKGNRRVPLALEIEKISDFAGESVGSSRRSDAVEINGLAWKIEAEIRKIDGTDEKKCLGFYLWCNAKEGKPSKCVFSATLRIASEKTEAENSIGKLCGRVFDNKSYGWEFNNFITFAVLMDQSNGCYNKSEDKVTLTIDVTVKDEKTEKFDSDQSKSNGTLSMEIENLSEFAREIKGSERRSEAIHIGGFPWKIWAEIKKKKGSTDNEKWLGIYLLCDAPKEDKTWECKCLATLRIVSQKSNTGDYCRKFSEERTFNSKSNSTWGYDNFISFAELMDPAKGFYDKSEDKVTLAIDVTVKEAKTEDNS
ncbi:hypothetical protein niasHS_008317 [Heterodera schachtii]|uniref:Uncharacterized protein n=1 Tax=Heterodera schachtii TaxID=97005 RepID=A0ABD2JA51_HETSC